MRIIAYFLIAIGVVTACYPLLSNVILSYHQQRLLAVYEQSYGELNHVFTSVTEGESREREQEEEEQGTEVEVEDNLLAVMQISRIDLLLPVLEGATLSNLKYAAGHLEGTSPIGAEGNAAIAAHRSYTYGQLFNRLDELEIGDEIVITSKDATYQYHVLQKLLVEPTDTSILTPPANDALLTLITCHPMNNPTHRLIIQAQKFKFK